MDLRCLSEKGSFFVSAWSCLLHVHNESNAAVAFTQKFHDPSNEKLKGAKAFHPFSTNDFKAPGFYLLDESLREKGRRLWIRSSYFSRINKSSADIMLRLTVVIHEQHIPWQKFGILWFIDVWIFIEWSAGKMKMWNCFCV